MKLLAAALFLPLAACSFGDGKDDDRTPGIAAQGSGSARTYQVADFGKVELRGSDDVDVRTGTAFSVRAEGPAAELDKLKITREGDTLRIGRKHGGFSWGNHRGDAVKVYFTMPRIAAATIAGSGSMTVDRAEGQRFEATDAGSGDLSIGTLAVDAAEVSIAGSGDMKLAGTAKQLDVNVAGSGQLTAPGLKAAGAKVSIAGSGNVKADVSGSADVSMLGSGDVDLGANAHCTISKMGSGSVTCGH